VVALVVAAGAVLVLPEAAAAQTGAIDVAKKTCDAAIAKRLASLGTVKKNLDAAPAVASPNRATLDSQTGRVQVAAGTLKHLAGLLQARVDAAKARGKDIASAQGYVTELGLKADAATRAVEGVPAAVLPLNAAGFPGNRPPLAAARASVETARGALKGAVAAAGSAIGALKALG